MVFEGLDGGGEVIVEARAEGGGEGGEDFLVRGGGEGWWARCSCGGMVGGGKVRRCCFEGMGGFRCRRSFGVGVGFLFGF